MIAARLFRTSSRDVLVLGAALVHGGAAAVGLGLAAGAGAAGRAAVAGALALGMCWGSNTVSHIHLHAPLFRGQAANRAFSLYLSLLLAVPQRWWKLRHLVHHQLVREERLGVYCSNSRVCALRAARLGLAGWSEILALLAALSCFGALAPGLFLSVYLPAVLMGLGLCAIQGWQEHARSEAGVDHHGRLYNRLWFNDGFHAAHHRAPGAHWTSLPAGAAAGDVTSPWPPIARWLDGCPASLNRLAAGLLDGLERATLGSRLVRHFLLATHRRAWAALLGSVDPARIREVTIVGGGLFPRTALVLSALLPRARLTIVETVPAHLARARAFLPAANVRWVAGRYEPGAAPADLVVIPLAYRGDRARLYREPPAPLLVVHDWLWRVRGDRGVIVSPWLLKRLNAVGG